MNHDDGVFMNLTNVERSRLQLQAIEENFMITSYDSLMPELPSYYEPQKVYPLSEIRVRLSHKSVEFQDAIAKFYDPDSKNPSSYTPDVTAQEKLAEAILSFMIASPSDESSLRAINAYEKQELLSMYGLAVHPSLIEDLTDEDAAAFRNKMSAGFFKRFLNFLEV